MAPADLAELRSLVLAEHSASKVVAHDAQGVPVTQQEFRALIVAEEGRRLTGASPQIVGAYLAGKRKSLAESPRGKGRMSNRERNRRTRRYIK